MIIEITENDILKAIKSMKYSPIEFAASRVFKQHVDSVEAQKHCIMVWNSDDSDYESYRYSDESIKDIRIFLEEWEDFDNNLISEFCSKPFSFSVQKNKKN